MKLAQRIPAQPSRRVAFYPAGYAPISKSLRSAVHDYWAVGADDKPQASPAPLPTKISATRYRCIRAYRWVEQPYDIKLASGMRAVHVAAGNPPVKLVFDKLTGAILTADF